MTHEEQARANFRAGYNCSQAVLLAFRDVTGLDDETAAKIAASFGGGMGRLREVCGAVSGMFMVIGLLEGYSQPKDGEAKAAHYRRVQELAAAFSDKNGSIVCRELLGLKVQKQQPQPEERTAAYYAKRPCELLVGDAAKILEAYLAKSRTML